MTSTGALHAGKPALERGRALRDQHRPAVGGAEARRRAWRGSRRSRPARTPCRAPPRAPGGGAASGSGSPGWRPSGVVFTTVDAASALGDGARPAPRAQSSKPAAPVGRPASAPPPRRRARAPRRPPPARRRRCRARATDRAAPPARRARRAGRRRRCCRRRVAPSSPQKVLQAPSRSTVGCGRSTDSRGDLLVRHGDVAAAARVAQRADQSGHVRRRAAERDVDRGEPEDPKGGVLHGRGERVRDRIAQDGEDARRAVDHRTVPATRLTTAADQLLQLGEGRAVAGEIGAERIADLGPARARAPRTRRAGAPCPRRRARPPARGGGPT